MKLSQSGKASLGLVVLFSILFIGAIAPHILAQNVIDQDLQNIIRQLQGIKVPVNTFTPTPTYPAGTNTPTNTPTTTPQTFQGTGVSTTFSMDLLSNPVTFGPVDTCIKNWEAYGVYSLGNGAQPCTIVFSASPDGTNFQATSGGFNTIAMTSAATGTCIRSAVVTNSCVRYFRASIVATPTQTVVVTITFNYAKN